MPSVDADFGAAWGIRVLFIGWRRQSPACVMPQHHLRIRLRPFGDRAWISISGPVSGPSPLFQDGRFHAWLHELVPVRERPVHVVLSAVAADRLASWVESFRALPFELVRLCTRAVRARALAPSPLFEINR